MFSLNRQDQPLNSDKIIKPTRISTSSSQEAYLQQIKTIEGAIERKFAQCHRQNKFVRHLSNFIFLQEHLNHPLINDIRIQYLATLQQMKTAQEAPQLYIGLLQFWTQSFFKIIDEISQCTESYALASFKNRPDNAEGKASSDQFKKRKGWSASQTERLQVLLNQHQPISSQALRDLSRQLNRSIVSIQSKVQKLLKFRKDENDKGKFDDLSLEKKIVTILKGYPEGLNREQVLTKLEEQFEMGEQQIWKKSASQLLCSSKHVQKIKGRFSISNSFSGKLRGGSGNIKNRVIKCLLEFDDHSANLKHIIRKYRELFGGQANAPTQKVTFFIKKTLEANISKALLRYPQFDRRQSKTVYRFVEIERTHSVHGDEEIEMHSDS